MLAKKASNTLLASSTINNLSSKNSNTIVKNKSIYRLKTNGLQLYSSSKTQNLSVNVKSQAKVHASTLKNAVIQSKTVILLSPTSANKNFVVKKNRAPVKLTKSVALLNSASIIISYGAKLQQSTITVQQSSVLILNGSTVKGDSVTFIVSNINLNSKKL